MSEWINVKDNLPDNFIEVETWGSNVIPIHAYYTENKWFDACDDTWITGVTFWMKLPDPPTE